MKLLTICDHTFDASRVTPGSVVVDLGVNIGQFGNALANGFRARVFGVEADARLFDNVLKGHWAFPVLHGAVASRPGKVHLHLNGSNFCPSVLYEKDVAGPSSIEVECLTLEELWKRWELSEVELMKMDIEGVEIDVLNQAPESLLAGINQLTCEFHDFMDPHALPGIRKVCARMEALGFRVIRFSRGDHGNVLFLNGRIPEFRKLSARARIATYKYLRMLKLLATKAT